ncbi:hypothetical protein SUSAZ_00160 [Sulfolobus acidocaldarius SUSAZ]|nr:hypothetical protein SUSAZ_00160 [Sulfolobus acidocaldarius SUSAZ]
MGRINIAADEKLVKELEQEAKKKGYTMYAVTNLAIQAMVEALREGNAETLLSLIEYYKIVKDLELIPVTTWYLENLIRIAYEHDSNRVTEICESAGIQLASYLKTKVTGLNDIINIYNKIRTILPVKDVFLKQDEDGIVIRITGSGFGLESTTCASVIFRKILEEYGFRVNQVSATPGGIIVYKIALLSAKEP